MGESSTTLFSERRLSVRVSKTPQADISQPLDFLGSNRLTKPDVIRMAKLVLGHFTMLSILAFLAKCLPMDPRIAVCLVLLPWNFIVLQRLPSRYALSLLFANYLVNVGFYQWGQIYPVLAVMCLLVYIESARPPYIALGRRWKLFLGIWLAGVIISALHGTLFLGGDELTQFVGVQEYIGCAAAFVLAYKTSCERAAEDESLLALGWMGVATAILALIAVTDHRLAREIIPGVGRVVYGREDITPFGYIPKLTIGVDGVTMAAFAAGAIGLSLLATRKVQRWAGLLILLSGGVTTLLLYRRSMIGGFLLVLVIVLLHYFGKSNKHRIAFAVIPVALVIIFSDLFLGQHFGGEYWTPYGQETWIAETRVDRWGTWKSVWTDVQRSPLFGLGPRFYSEADEFSSEISPVNPHSFLLGYLRALGLPVGLLCSGALMLLVYRSVRQSVLERRRTPVFSLSVLGGFFAASAFFGVFGDFQRQANTHILVWALAGLSAGLARREELYGRLGRTASRGVSSKAPR